MTFSHHLHDAFIPHSVAVVGADIEAHRRGTTIWNGVMNSRPLIEAYPVNPNYHVLGHSPCWASLKELPAPVDLAVIATASNQVADVLKECADVGIGHALIPPGDPALTADRHWREQLVNLARAHGIRLIGPDSTGIMRPEIGLNISSWPELPEIGRVALLCQSGAVTATVLDYSKRCAFGFSSVITTGLESDVSLAETLDFLSADPQTDTIALHIETLRNPRAFYSALKAAARNKPVIILKAGRGPNASRLIASRTGTLSSDDSVFDALLERTGAIRCDRIEEFCSTIEVFSTQKQPRSGRLAILANGMGFCALACDAADANGLPLARLSHWTSTQLGAMLQSKLTAHNPVDIGPDANPEQFGQALSLLLNDDQVDALCVHLTPSTAVNSPATIDAIGRAAARTFKPVIVTWVSETIPETIRLRLKRNGLPALLTPDLCAKAFANLLRYEKQRALRLAEPTSGSEPHNIDLEPARRHIDHVRAQELHRLPQESAHALLRQAGIETLPGRLTHSPAHCLQAAREIGYPVALKVSADGVAHKTDIGGVLLDIRTDQDVLKGYETIQANCARLAPLAAFKGVFVHKMADRPFAREFQITVATDPTLGPSLRIGSGGRTGELFDDLCIGLPPLNEPLVHHLVNQTRIGRSLHSYRDLPDVDLKALTDSILKVSHLVCEMPCLAELTINPLLVDESGCVAVDVQVALNAKPTAPDRRHSHLVIAPTPHHIERTFESRIGSMRLRSIRPDDYAALKNLLTRISQRSAYLRFHKEAADVTHNELIDFTQIDNDREAAHVIENADNPGFIRAVARFAYNPGIDVAEFGILVEDDCQCLGFGSRLMRSIEQEARDRGIKRMVGYILKGNDGMAALMRRRGFIPGPCAHDDNMLTYTLLL